MSVTKNIILFGAPGCGKGTQGVFISKSLKCPVIAMGDMLREILKQDSSLASEVEKYVSSGKLVPDDIAGEVLKNRILKEDCRDGFILDGYPRNLSQAKILDELNVKIDKFIYICVSEEEILSRLLDRQICSKCGAVYNTKTLKPSVEGVCNRCGSKLVVRGDDNRDTIVTRLKVFNDALEDLKTFYLAQGKFFSINGEGEIDAVSKQLLDVIEDRVNG